MIITLRKNVDLYELGDWLELNVGPINIRVPEGMGSLSRPVGTPLAKGRKWVIDSSVLHNTVKIEIDFRTIKPTARSELILRFA